MESSQTELNRTTSSPAKHEHETTALANLDTHHSPSHDHPFHDDDNDDDDKSTSSPASPPAHEIPALESSIPNSEPSDHGSACVPSPTPPTTLTPDSSPCGEPATEPPPIQEMERSASTYRIPSSVFERSQSSMPQDWSVASNESLFSIHMGNMSFTNDQYFWRSGDLGPPAEASTSDQMFSYSADDSAGGVAAILRSHELGIAEATMLEVIKESEGENHQTSLAEMRSARRSEGSNTSNKSFAFSIMGGDTGSSVRMPSSVRSNLEQSQSQPMAKPELQPDEKPPEETEPGARYRWLCCFACCSFR